MTFKQKIQANAFQIGHGDYRNLVTVEDAEKIHDEVVAELLKSKDLAYNIMEKAYLREAKKRDELKQKLNLLEEQWRRAYPLDSSFDQNVQKILTKLFYEISELLSELEK